MKTSILLKMEYLLDNFDSIESYDFTIQCGRNHIGYLLIVKANTNYLTKEQLNKALSDYFKDTPIVYSIIIDEE